MLNIDGSVIGVNTAILGERSAGIGFAIPIDRARRVAEDLIAHGEVREGYLGIAVRDLPSGTRTRARTIRAPRVASR